MCGSLDTYSCRLGFSDQRCDIIQLQVGVEMIWHGLKIFYWKMSYKKLKDLSIFFSIIFKRWCLSIIFRISCQSHVDITKIIEGAFADRPISTFAKLTSVKWTRQQVHVFFKKIKQFAGSLGEGLNNILGLTLVDGWSDNMSAHWL